MKLGSLRSLRAGRPRGPSGAHNLETCIPLPYGERPHRSIQPWNHILAARTVSEKFPDKNVIQRGVIPRLIGPLDRDGARLQRSRCRLGWVQENTEASERVVRLISPPPHLFLDQLFPLSSRSRALPRAVPECVWR
eukprot:6133648-Pyramimonas_sp.AAC.1